MRRLRSPKGSAHPQPRGARGRGRA
jgi:hypothetical protein